MFAEGQLGTCPQYIHVSLRNTWDAQGLTEAMLIPQLVKISDNYIRSRLAFSRHSDSGLVTSTISWKQRIPKRLSLWLGCSLRDKLGSYAAHTQRPTSWRVVQSALSLADGRWGSCDCGASLYPPLAWGWLTDKIHLPSTVTPQIF